MLVTDQTFGSAELLLFGLAQMTEPFSAEHRTFFSLLCIAFFKMATLTSDTLNSVFTKKLNASDVSTSFGKSQLGTEA
jgi:hypothetical protein